MKVCFVIVSFSQISLAGLECLTMLVDRQEDKFKVHIASGEFKFGIVTQNAGLPTNFSSWWKNKMAAVTSYETEAGI